MLAFRIVLIGLLIGFEVDNSSLAENDSALILTPLIEGGRIEEARRRADVHLNGFRLFNVTSYSGFFTVNTEFNSNLFFWYLEAAENKTTAPVMVYTSGWNASSLFGLFNLNGHASIEGFRAHRRHHSFHKFCHMVYLDHAVGRGFSFTEDDRGYRTDQEGIAEDMFSAVVQFFRLFPELKGNGLYLGGASYGGKAALSLAHRIHNSNESGLLKGVFLSAPFIDPVGQMGYGDFLTSVGLLGRVSRRLFDREESAIRQLVSAGNYTESGKRIGRMIFGRESTLAQATGFVLSTNYVYDRPYDMDWEGWMEVDDVRAMLHVGARRLSDGEMASARLAADIARSVTPTLEQLLAAGYRVLMTGGQLDLVCNHPALVRLLEALQWPGKRGFADARRKTLMDGALPGAYLTAYHNLAYVLFLASDHSPEIRNPDSVYAIVRNFLRGVPVEEWSLK
ncbi:hypothetical protein AAG570_002836 [Ranatra chinensis]|uniref:Serine carboxypeptidase n=1 Tax=Ranatra chinensis TaxID=642074 RepID=A0ABD0Y547_9HEMI